MLSRVAAVMAPRTHNRRRVTGSSGRRREGRESEPQRSNMSRRVFNSTVLLLLVVLMCSATCGATAATENDGNSDLRSVEGLQWVDLFVPQTTPVLPEGGGTPGTKRDAFVSPSLVSAGGVIAAFAGGHMNAQYDSDVLIKPLSSDVVAEYIDSSWDWSTLVEKVSESTWRAHTVLDTTDGTNRVGVVFNPTTTTKGNKVFLLAGSYDMLNESDGNWKRDSLDLKLVVGDVTKPTASEPSGWITWGTPTSLSQTTLKTPSAGLKDFASSGVSGVVMEDGTLVFPLMAFNTENVGFSMIIYSKDDGSAWALSTGVSSAKCLKPRITEWEGSLLMIVDCESSQRVYESRDVGATWTEAVGTLPGVWTKSKPEVSPDVSLHVEALITATIEGREVMLYIQRGYASGEKRATALYLWVTDNNRSFSVGPVAVEEAEKWEFASALLYSDGSLHLLQRRDNDKGRVISLSRLTEELKTIKSTLSTWAQLDASFSASSTPTVGLVGLLSNAASGDTWIDDYHSVNATVRNAVKVHDGFKFTGFGSGAIWPVNHRESNGPHSFVNYNFTLVATVIVHKVPKNSTTLLGAVLAEPISTLFIGLSYGTDGTWETVFNGETTKSGSTWRPGKEHQVAIMLQDGNKGSVYVDGASVGSLATLPTPEVRGAEIADFYFVGGEDEEDKKSSSVTVKNVFLYNRPLGVDELRMVKKSDGSMHGGVSRALLLLGMWGIAALY
ncbi:trans-sialidase-like protein [Trypanosoma cruzi]|uniref:Trans-sialidase, putative n=1 Tax=Trypanosoma cruzi (strain CL Brener) TaxID=353153 RepID=Q4DBC9_TRYCC|nr:trans-sialidase, putative [Trypanosoma cruzi]EAN89832.1 trans-sialidase, putative [Trypanosoma cruzi]RNC56468.1 trans-sialidase-like protein [Trypanosoma cruzi]|eukprot:XP_811683.1 trans-sialidase [Trypanosoma cruzi strain CL Brener]